MNVLLVTNLYPPYTRGGYEIRCRDFAEAATAAGHSVVVLTSAVGVAESARERHTEQANGVTVHRWLNQFVFPPYLTRRPWRYWRAHQELEDARRFLEVARSFSPAVVNWWSMYGLSKLLLQLPHTLGVPDVHWIEQAWMPDEYGCDGSVASAFWAGVWNLEWVPGPVRPFVRPLARRWRARIARSGISTTEFPNRPAHVCHVSGYMQDYHHARGCRFDSEEVIPGGVSAERFFCRRQEWPGANLPLRVLYVGQLTPDRGLHTVLEAVAGMTQPVRLSVAGDGVPEYVAAVRARAQAADLAARVSFLGRLPHDAIPAAYREHDVLVFASTRHEGMPLTLVEAMLAGCAVVATRSGGAVEVLEATGQAPVPANDPAALATRLDQLAMNRDALRSAAERGQEAAFATFALERTMPRYLAMLDRVAARATQGSDSGAVPRAS